MPVWSDERGHVRIQTGDEDALNQRRVPRVQVRVLQPGTAPAAAAAAVAYPFPCRRYPDLSSTSAPPAAAAAAAAAGSRRRIASCRPAARHRGRSEPDLGKLLPELLAQVIQPLQGRLREELLAAPPAHFVVGAGAALPQKERP